MLSSEALAKKVSFIIATELELDNDNEAIINYGIFALIQMIYNIFLVILIGFIFDVIIEALIVSFSISILRKSSGGAHASTSGICTIIGTLVAVILGMLSKLNVQFHIIIISEIIIFIWAYCIIYKLAPVDSTKKPIKTEKKKLRLRKSSIIILSIYLILVMCNTLLYYYTEIDSLRIYSICILYGVMWQVLSLTKIGHSIVNFIDTFFYKIKIMLLGGNSNEENK